MTPFTRGTRTRSLGPAQVLAAAVQTLKIMPKASIRNVITSIRTMHASSMVMSTVEAAIVTTPSIA
jgi:hypothetical protein